MLVQLGVMAVGGGHGEPAPEWLACQNLPRLPVRDPSRLTAKLTANRHDTRDSWPTALNGYIRPELRRCG